MKKALYLLSLIAVLQSCATSRALVRWSPDADDHRFFYHTEIIPEEAGFRFHDGNNLPLSGRSVNASEFGMKGVEILLDDFLATKDKTLSFLIIRNDSILYENYFNGHGHEDISAAFSVTKSVVSLLTGIAIEDGFIGSIDDPVTKYLPELAGKHPHWSELTITHLLDMRSGFKFNEDSRSPFSKSASFYYGNNLRKRVGRLKFEARPGTAFKYQSASTAVLGLVLESAIGCNLGQYFDEKVAKPLGMQNEIKWAIDDRKNNASKGHSGLFISATDLAKIGRLYLSGGEWNGKRIVSPEWIEGTFAPLRYHRSWYRLEIWLKNIESEDHYFDSEESARRLLAVQYPGIKYFTVWESERAPGRWGVTTYPDRFHALGIYQQVLYINPEKNLIGVRLGENSSLDYAEFIYFLTDDL